MKTKKLLFLLSFLIAGLCSNIVAQIQFQDGDCHTFSMVTLNQSDMVDGRNTFTGADFGITYRIIWTGNRWEIQADELGFLQAIYYNTTPSTPNPPDLTLGTWVHVHGICTIGSLTGEVQNVVDLSAPIFENSTPSISSITETGCMLNTDIDEAGAIYYVVVADAATAPTVAEVKAGTGNGGSGQISAGNQVVSTGAFAYDFLVAGLTASTSYDVYVVAEDDEATPNVQASVTKLDVTTIDTTPPTFKNSTPSVSSITETGCMLHTDIDEAGTIYYVVVADAATAPTVAEVKAGTGNGGSGQIFAGNQVVSTGAFAYDFLVAGLIGGTDYDVYVVAEDDETTPNVQASVTKLDVTTIDTTPPTFENSTPSVSSITETGFMLNTDIDEAGTIYYVVVADAATAPTVAEVKAGTGNGGSGQISAGNQVVNSVDFVHGFSIAGLTASTSYDVYVVAEDDETTPNVQASAIQVDVTTVDITPPTFENSTPSISSITDTGCMLNIDIDEAGTVYYVVVADGATAPTVAEVKAGTGNGGSGQISAGNQVVNSVNFSDGFSIAGLTAATSYDVYVVAEDDETVPNVQVSVAKVDVITLNSAPPANAVNLWGVDANIDKANAEFANAFVQETNSNNLSNTTWTAVSINDTDGTVTPGNAFWTRSTLGYSQGAYWSDTTPVSSPSQANGVAIFDSDFMDNAGVVGNFNNGTSPSKHKGELISPPINLTGFTNKQLYVKFFKFYRELTITELSVSFSTDNGATWGAGLDFKYNSLTEEFIELALPVNTTQGVTDLSKCRLKFTFDGDYYFAIVDDVTIKTNNNWTGAIGDDWNEPGNWSANMVPTATDNVFIPNDQYPEIKSGVNVAVNNLIIGTESYLTVRDGGSITINGDLELKEEAAIEAFSLMPSEGVVNSGSVILKGAYTEVSPYSFRYTSSTHYNNDKGWSLVSSPTVGDFIDGNMVPGSSIPVGFAILNGLQKNATKYGIAKYDNAVTTNRWDYYTIAEIEVAANNIPMTSGKGFSILPDPNGTGYIPINGTMLFKGSIPTNDISIAITDNSTGSGTGVGNAFNLIGNPYPASIPANENADATNNILTTNAGVLAEQTLWFWKKEAPVDGVTKGSYVTVNQATVSKYITPTQGFFVKSNTAGGNFNFTKTMESHQEVGGYNRNSTTRPEISLTITQDNTSRNTSVYYINGTTTGFDNGYDSTVFGGDLSELQLFTGLVDNTSEKQLAIQSLPDSNYEAMVIPVGIKAVVGKEVTLSTDAINLPTGVEVYLEDRENGVFTNLSEGSYKFVLDAEATSAGRFYLHLSSRALSIDTVNTVESIGIFKSNKNELTVSGLATKGTLQLYNVLGKKVLSKTLESKSIHTVMLPSLAKGVYVAQLVSAKGTLSKKIIIE